MKLSSDYVMGTMENERRCPIMRYDVKDMHLVNRMPEERLRSVGRMPPRMSGMGVDYYLEMRKDGFKVGNICRECKLLAMPLAAEIIEAAVEEHEAEGRFDVAEDYQELGKSLARETGQDSLAG